jgi:hypothetical protein
MKTSFILLAAALVISFSSVSEASLPSTSSWMTVQAPLHFEKPIVANGTRCISNFKNLVAGQYPATLSTSHADGREVIRIQFVNQAAHIDCVKQASALKAQPNSRDIEADLVQLGIWI